MDPLSALFTGTTLLAILGYIGYQLKGVPIFIYQQIRKKLIYSAHIDQDEYLYSSLKLWLEEKYPEKLKNIKASYSYDTENLRIDHYADVFAIKYKNKRILITKHIEKVEHGQISGKPYFEKFKVEAWLGKNEVIDMLNEIIEYRSKIVKTKQYIYLNDTIGNIFQVGEIKGKSIKNIVLKEKDYLINDINDFVSKEKWYFNRGLNYRRGYLFYGPPGNGKTSLCLGIAKHFNKDIYFLNLNDIKQDSALIKFFTYMSPNSILVVEDVDAILGCRDGEAKVSFSSLLNCMDGAFSKHNLITIMTTNHIEKIDSALIREGRIDVKINIENPDIDMIEKYLSTFYDKEVKLKSINYQKLISMSKIQEICLSNKNNSQDAIDTIEKIELTTKQKLLMDKTICTN